LRTLNVQLALLATVLFGPTISTSPLSAQISPSGQRVGLGPYLSASHSGETNIVGLGVALSRAVSAHLDISVDASIGALGVGCPATLGADCPNTYWHLLVGTQWSPVGDGRQVRPFAGFAMGLIDVGDTAVGQRWEVGVDFRLSDAVALRAAPGLILLFRRDDFISARAGVTIHL
jgi:hypothetical protein